MRRALTRPLGRLGSSPRTLAWVFLTYSRTWRTMFCLMKKKLLRRRRLLMRSRVLRSEAMMPKFRLPFVYFLFFFILGFWPHGPCNYDNFYFSSMHMLFLCWQIFPYVYVMCLPLFMQQFVTCGSMNRSLWWTWCLWWRKKQDLGDVRSKTSVVL